MEITRRDFIWLGSVTAILGLLKTGCTVKPASTQAVETTTTPEPAATNIAQDPTITPFPTFTATLTPTTSDSNLFDVCLTISPINAQAQIETSIEQCDVVPPEIVDPEMEAIDVQTPVSHQTFELQNEDHLYVTTIGDEIGLEQIRDAQVRAHRFIAEETGIDTTPTHISLAVYNYRTNAIANEQAVVHIPAVPLDQYSEDEVRIAINGDPQIRARIQEQYINLYQLRRDFVIGWHPYPFSANVLKYSSPETKEIINMSIVVNMPFSRNSLAQLENLFPNDIKASDFSDEEVLYLELVNENSDRAMQMLINEDREKFLSFASGIFVNTTVSGVPYEQSVDEYVEYLFSNQKLIYYIDDRALDETNIVAAVTDLLNQDARDTGQEETTEEAVKLYIEIYRTMPREFYERLIQQDNSLIEHIERSTKDNAKIEILTEAISTQLYLSAIRRLIIEKSNR